MLARFLSACVHYIGDPGDTKTVYWYATCVHTHKFNKRGITRVLCMSCTTCDNSTITHSAHSALARTTKKMVAAKFVWPGLQKQVGIWAKACLRCQAAKVHRHTTAPLDQFTPATRRFDHIHVDIVGPLPPSQNYRYLLTVVDIFTRWPEAIPLVDSQTITCAKAFAFHCIARFWCSGRSDVGQRVTV